MQNSNIDSKSRGVAIVGISGRYPGGANTPAKLWKNLTTGVDAVSEARGDRWDLGYHHPDPSRPERVYTRAGGFLDRIDGFDHEFFGLSPREVRQVDPQQRLLLELAWEAIEDACIPLNKIAGSDAGVFIGISSNDYASLVGPGGPDAYSNTGSSFSIAANRISYFLDLHGPSVALDTACSSSIVGVHQACTSLLNGDCSIALAGGVSLLVHIRPWLGFAKASMLSPTGRCKSFDASGDGYVRSEGGGIVVLKPLEAAERDGDSIYGVILASGVNSDGHTLGLSMPNVDAQERLLRKVYSACGVPPEDVVYVEAHGTGTSVGDPIECESLGRVLGQPRTDGSNVLLGSVKSNIGHLEAASGMAGLTKALLALHHKEVPGNLHFNTPNPKIKFDEWKLEVVTTTTPLPKGDKPIVIGVNSFGFGGTNAHLAIQEYLAGTSPAKTDKASDWQNVLILTAHTPSALQAVAKEYVTFLREQTSSVWREICAAAALCRSHLRYRLAVSADSALEAADKLEKHLAGETPLRVATGNCTVERAPIAFVYSGNGPQWWGMGRELMASHVEFRNQIQAIDAIFAPLAGWSLVEEMGRPETESRMALTEIAQPLLFALQVALTSLLRSAGIQPAVTLGHSVGEVAAAYEAGAMTLEQATQVIFNRSMQQARTAGLGTMAAIGVSSDDALAAIKEIPGWMELAASNAPKAVTVAGDPAALEKLRATMIEAGKFARILPLQYAFHTTAMDIIKDDLIESLKTLAPQATTIPFISTVKGIEISGLELGAEYWWRNVREPVRFYEAVDHLITERGIGVFLEIGPHPVLRDYILQTAKAKEMTTAAFGTLRRPAANRPEPEVDNLWTAICACHASGASDATTLFTRPYPLPALPLYPWQHTRHWRGGVTLPDAHHPLEREHPLLGYRVSATDGLWENTLDTNQLPYLVDHVVQDSVVFPAAAYIESALSATRLLFGEGIHDVESFEILRPLTIPTHTDPLIQFAADSKDGTFEISSRSDKHFGEWTRNVRGRLSKVSQTSDIEVFNAESIKAGLPCHMDGAEHYNLAARRGLAYGPAFQGVLALYMSPPDGDKHEALAEIYLPTLDSSALSAYRAHPSLTDSCVQVILTLIGQNEHRNCSIIPVFIERIRSYAPVPNHLYCHVTITRESDRSTLADFSLFDLEGKLVVSLLGTRCQKVDFKHGSPSSLIAEWWRLDPASVTSFGEPTQSKPPLQLINDLTGKISATTAKMGRAAFYRDIQPALTRLAGAYAAKALAELGAASGPFSLARLMKRGRVKSDQERFLSSLIDMAEADGQLIANEKGWTWNEGRYPEAAESIWQQILTQYPGYITELMLIARAGDSLGAVLRGELTLSQSDHSGLDQLFESAPFQAVYNRIAGAVMESLVETWPLDRPIRILEVGGGGGGLTTALLPVLPAHRTDYLFTDISDVALGRARHRFEHHQFVRFGTFDLEKTAKSQDQPIDYFDIVIAGNCLHTASDLHNALSNIYAVLNAGGLLLAIENHEQRLTTIAFGSDPNWWRVADSDVRSRSRLLTAAAWPEAMKLADFEDPQVLSDAIAVPFEAPTQQSILLARKPISATIARQLHRISESSEWLILAGPAEVDSPTLLQLTDSLRTRGQNVSIKSMPDGFSLSDDDAKAMVANASVDMIVHFAGASQLPQFELPANQREARCLSALKLVQAIELNRHDHPPKLTFITCGALASPFSGPLNPGHAPVWGLARVISNEYPNLGCRMIDLHADLSNPEAGLWLAEELLRRDDETEVQLHKGMRYVNRERLASLGELALESRSARKPSAYRLDFQAQGGLDSLYLRELDRRVPGPDEVEIQVSAAGLNFRDVLWAMGMLPEEAVEKGFSGPTIGMECSGEIVRVGANADFKVGDRVIAFASSCFSSHVTTHAGSVALLPDAIDFEAAATIPITFLTAYYALDHLARLAPGETVLIHGAAGGVGLAAIQIAKLKSARVIGTAGSPAKRRVVEMLGADHVLNSRSLEFADEVMKLTGGMGVDVVLNSLAGEAITKGLQILRPFGRFLEIGKRDLYANSRIGLRPFRQNLSYFGIDADTLLIERPELAQNIFRTVTAHFATGALRPIPFQTIPISRASEAFRAMQQSRHVGKLVISMGADILDSLPIVRSKIPIRSDSTYLVSGGLGGFGLTTAQWLVAQGARSIALIGRRGAVTEEAQTGISEMENRGATVRAFAADVSNPDAVSLVIDEIRRDMLPLRGVIHSAAVIEDAPILNITGELLERVLQPKMRGAWNLHEATLRDPIEMFVLYSSSSVMVGNPGQGAYVAANLYLESLAQYRRSLGLPALAVGWGAIKDTGFLTRHAAVAEMLKNRSGLDATPAAEALVELGRLTAVDASRVCIARFNLQRLGQMLSGSRIPRFLPIIPQGVATDAQDSETLADLLKATSANERQPLITSRIKEHAARVLGTSADQIEAGRSLAEMGLDSLMAVELAEAVERDIAKPISVMQMLSAGTINAIAELVLKSLGLGGDNEQPTTGAPSDSANLAVEPAKQTRDEGVFQTKS